MVGWGALGREGTEPEGPRRVRARGGLGVSGPAVGEGMGHRWRQWGTYWVVRGGAGP